MNRIDQIPLRDQEVIMAAVWYFWKRHQQRQYVRMVYDECFAKQTDPHQLEEQLERPIAKIKTICERIMDELQANPSLAVIFTDLLETPRILRQIHSIFEDQKAVAESEGWSYFSGEGDVEGDLIPAGRSCEDFVLNTAAEMLEYLNVFPYALPHLERLAIIKTVLTDRLPKIQWLRDSSLLALDTGTDTEGRQQ
ncbi:MAG: hypothetical protein WCW17_02730 [Patescibacteria group bacterium]|jgi:hypothetical protein